MVKDRLEKSLHIYHVSVYITADSSCHFPLYVSASSTVLVKPNLWKARPYFSKSRIRSLAGILCTGRPRNNVSVHSAH